MTSIKGLIMTVIGVIVGGLFAAIGWLDGWIYFAGLLVVSLLLINQNFSLVPVGYIGMVSTGTFTKFGWLDPFIFFSILIIVVVILAQQIVKRQLDIGHGTSGTGAK